VVVRNSWLGATSSVSQLGAAITDRTGISTAELSG